MERKTRTQKLPSIKFTHKQTQKKNFSKNIQRVNLRLNANYYSIYL